MGHSDALEKDKISTLLWKFSLPAISGMVVNALYNVIDSIFVGNGVGEIGLTAVTIAFPIMIVMMAFGMLIGVGAGALISIRLGEKNKEGAEAILGNACTLVILIAALLTALILLFLDPILMALGAQAKVLPYAREFIRIILMGSIFMYIGYGLNNIIRAEGNPRTAMATMLIAAALNTMLNPLFIFIFKLGIAGSALATVVSQSVSASWVVWHFFSKKSVLKIHLANLYLRKDIVLGIVKIGLSPFLMQIGASAGTFLFNYSLLKYGGDLAVAAFGVINRVAMLLVMPVFGISQGAQPIIGYNYGAKQYLRVLEALQKAIRAAVVFSLVGLVVIEVFPAQIIRLFNGNPELIAMGSGGLRIMLCMLPIIGFQIISANYFQAVGKAGHAIFLSMSKQVLLLMPMIFILPGFFGLNGAWLAGPVADVLSSLLTGTFLFWELKKLGELRG